MTLRSTLSIAAATLFGLSAALATHAATLSPGDLIKISSRSDVYYYGVDQKRYVFPNEKTYFTWYTDFSTKTLTDSELAAVQIGGAATYRPGKKLIKVTTDPKVYAVSRGGTLRWIETEQVAAALYGPDWNTKVDDLSDAFFTTYKVGASISKVADFNPSDELAMNTTISMDKQLVAPGSSPTTTTPTPTPTSTTVDLQISKNEVRAGDILGLTASSTPASGISKIELFFDGVLIKTCTFSPCAAETQVPLSGTKPQYEAKAVMTALNATTATKIVTIVISDNTSGLVTLTITRNIVKPGQAADAIVTSDASIAVIRTDIYINGDSIEACATPAHECRWSDILPGGVGTVYDVYGRVTDSLGRLYDTAHKTITIGTNDSPMVTVTPAKSMIFKGETLDVTVSASDDDGITSIEILKDGVVLKTCNSAAPCTVTTGPWTSTGTISFVGRATDSKGTVSTSDPVSVTVTNP
ncbi:MAG: Ig-like domain-containing protein [Patescibacteria group bacterium]